MTIQQQIYQSLIKQYGEISFKLTSGGKYEFVYGATYLPKPRLLAVILNPDEKSIILKYAIYSNKKLTSTLEQVNKNILDFVHHHYPDLETNLNKDVLMLTDYYHFSETPFEIDKFENCLAELESLTYDIDKIEEKYHAEQ